MFSHNQLCVAFMYYSCVQGLVGVPLSVRLDAVVHVLGQHLLVAHEPLQPLPEDGDLSGQVRVLGHLVADEPGPSKGAPRLEAGPRRPAAGRRCVGILERNTPGGEPVEVGRPDLDLVVVVRHLRLHESERIVPELVAHDHQIVGPGVVVVVVAAAAAAAGALRWLVIALKHVLLLLLRR